MIALHRWAWLLLLLIVAPLPASAHLGNPDTYVQTTAGPYTVLAAVHPPALYPGSMELDLHLRPEDQIEVASAWLDDAAPEPARLYPDGNAVASLWMATPASHTLYLRLQGARGVGSAELRLPASAVPTGAQPSRGPLVLAELAALIGVSLTLYLGLRRRRWFAAGVSALGTLLVITVCLRPHASPTTTVTAEVNAQGLLDLALSNPAGSFNDIVPDHGKPMHLFLVREPQQDVLLHLHPESPGSGRFRTQLPAMPPGMYALFADLYHADGRPETATLQLALPAQLRTPLATDDSSAILPPRDRATALDANDQQVRLPDGYTMQLHVAGMLSALHPLVLQCTLLNRERAAPMDMQLYLGMNAHAVVLGSDSKVFAHLHPGGNLPMPSMAGMDMGDGVPNMAEIAYGFPSPGRYRVFIQMKHGATVETGAFDLQVH